MEPCSALRRRRWRSGRPWLWRVRAAAAPVAVSDSTRCSPFSISGRSAWRQLLQLRDADLISPRWRRSEMSCKQQGNRQIGSIDIADDVGLDPPAAPRWAGRSSQPRCFRDRASWASRYQ